MVSSDPLGEGPDWFCDATAWIHQQIADARLGAVTAIAPVTSATSSAVFSVDTTAGRAYFKAAGASLEVGVTAVLARDYPAHAPPVIAADIPRGWMLVRQVSGTPLLSTTDVKVWATAFQTLAHIQRDFAGRIDELRDLGCADRTVPWVDRELGRALVPLLRRPDVAALLTDDEREAMTAAVPRWQARSRTVAFAGVPEASLDHGDLHPFNVLLSDTGAPVFLDWEAAAIAHPFCAPHVLLGYVDRLLPTIGASASVVRHAYLRPWLDWSSMPVLLEAFEHVRPLAALNYGLGVARLGPPAAHLRPQARKAADTIAFCLRRALAAGASP